MSIEINSSADANDPEILKECIDSFIGLLNTELQRDVTCRKAVGDLIRQLYVLSQDLHRKQCNISPYSAFRLAMISSNVPEKHQCHGPGRPKYIITEDKLLYLRELGFTWNNISVMLMVSRWTIYRRIAELGLKDVTGYSKLSDSELDSVILQFKQQHGINVGRSLVLGHLKSIGLACSKKGIG